MYISKKYFLITNKIVKLLIGPNKKTGELNYMRMRKKKKKVTDTKENESLQENNQVCSNKFEINFCLAKCKQENEVHSRRDWKDD